MSYDLALSLFKASNTPETILQAREDKLAKALELLGQKHLLANPVQRLVQPRSY